MFSSDKQNVTGWVLSAYPKVASPLEHDVFEL